MNDKVDSWTRKAVKDARPAAARFFPSEVMLHALLSERYTGWPVRVAPGMRMLDIGALHAGNFAPFADRGCDCFGVEVNEEMVDLARDASAAQGIAAQISIGTNRNLPFAAAEFDILVSVNTIHYEDDAAGLSAALAEYRRVLRPGGRAFVVTVAPDHFIRRSAERLGANRYRLTFGDFRAGQTMSYFEEEEQLASMCRTHFAKAVTGRVTERHPAASLDFFYAMAEA